jgi:hypothetical protein
MCGGAPSPQTNGGMKTPPGIYELCDAKRQLGAINRLVQHFFEDGDDRLLASLPLGVE